MKNEIIGEVRKARAALAAEHGYDRQRIYEWARATHETHKQVQRTLNPNKSPATTGGAAKPPAQRDSMRGEQRNI
jgi:hypothetical protein